MSNESTSNPISKSHQKQVSNDEILNLMSSLSSTWKQYEITDNKEAIIHTIHVIFLELYDNYRISFKSIEDGFKPLTNTFTRASCKLLIDIYNECMVNGDNESLQQQSDRLYESLLKNINTLKILLILSQELSSLDILAEENLPSYLVKIYHSLFNLPLGSIKESAPIDVIVNILYQLSMNKVAVKHLVDTDTLILLFTMSAAYTPNHFLREKIHPVSLVIIKFCLTKDVVNYLQKNECISTLCTMLASNTSQLSTLDIYDIINLIISLVEESTKVGSSFLSNFNNSQGYSILTQCLLHIDGDKVYSNNEGEKIIDLITSLIYIGTEDLNLEYDRENIYSPIIELDSNGAKIYRRRDGKECKPPTLNLDCNSKRVKNSSAFQVLQNYFLASNNTQLKDIVLESIAKVFSSHEDNYFLLQHQRTIALFIEHIPFQDPKLWESIQRLFLFIATGLNMVPYYEILALVNLFEESVLSNNYELTKFVFDILNFIINYDPIFKTILNDAKFMYILLRFMKGYITSKIKHDDEIIEDIGAEEIKFNDFDLVMELMIVMLTDNPTALMDGEIDKLLPYLFKYDTIWGIKMVKSLIIEDKDKRFERLSTLLGFFKECKDITVIPTIHECLCDLFCHDEEIKVFFKMNEGYNLLLSSFELLEGKFSNSNDTNIQSYFGVLESLFKTLCCAIMPSASFNVFISNDLLSILYKGIQLSKIMEYQPYLIFSWLFKLAILSHSHTTFEKIEKLLSQDYKDVSTYFDFDQPIVYKPSFLVLLFDLICCMENEKRITFLGHLFNIIQELMLKICNIEIISTCNLFQKVQNVFENEIANPESIIYKIVNKFIILMGSYKINTIEMSNIFKLMDPYRDSKYIKEHLSTLTSIIQLGVTNQSPFFYFDHSTSNSGNISATIQNISWPSNTGFSVSFWLYFDRLSPETVDILTISNNRVLFSVSFLKGQLYIHSCDNEEIVIDSIRFQSNKWYHIVIVHEKRRIYSSETKVYIDGLLRTVKKENIITPLANEISVTLGSSMTKIISNNEIAKALWRLGPFYIFDLSLSAQDVYSMYNLGHSYFGNFQGSLLEYFTSECLNSKFLIVFEELTSTDPKNIGLSKLTLSHPIPQDRILISINAAKQKIIEEFGSSIHKESFSSSSSSKSLEQSPTNKSDQLDLSKSKRQEDQNVTRIISDLKFESPNSPILCWPSSLPYNMYRLNGIEILLFLLEYSTSIDILNINDGKLQLTNEDESLSYIVLKGILHYVKKIPHNFIEFGKKNAYSIITLILKKNPLLLTKEKVQLLFDFIGITKEQIISESQEQGTPRQNRIHISTLSNVLAFKYFILDYSVWKKCSVELKIEIFEYLQTLLDNNPSYRFNASRLHRLNSFLTFINTFKDKDIVPELYQSMITFLGNLMMSSVEVNDIRSVANFIIYTFSKKSGLPTDRLESLRYMLVKMLYQVILRSNVHPFSKLLDCNWMFLFFNNETNPNTVSIMLKILCVFFKERHGYLAKFTKYHGMKLLENALLKFHDNIDIYCTLLCMLFKKSPDEIPSDVNENCNFIDLFPAPEDGYTIESKHILYIIPTLIKQHLSDQLKYIKENPTEDNKWSPTLGSDSPRRKRSKSCIDHSPTRIRSSIEQKKRPSDLENLYLRFDKIQRPLRRSSISKAKSTVTDALKSVIKGRQQREQSKMTINIPHKLFGGKVIQSPKISNKVIPSFFTKEELFYRNGSPHDINNRRLSLIKELIRFIDHLYTYSHQLKEILNSKYDFVHYIILILFQEDGLLLDIDNTSSDNIDVHRFANLVLELLSNIITEHTIFNYTFKEQFLEDVFEVTPHYGMKISQTFCNHLFESIFDKVLKLYKRETFDTPKYIQTIIKFCNYSIDKLCIKLYSKGLVNILEYLSDHIKYILTTKIEHKQELDLLIKTLNRLVIVSLMDIQYSKDNNHILNTLTTILNYQSSILHQGNSDKEFYVCLCFILLSLLHNDSNEIKSTIIGLLRMIILNKRDILELILKKQDEKLGSIIDGIELILQSELQPFLTWFSKITNISDIFDESADKLRKTFFSNEDKLAEEKKIQLKKNYQVGKHRTARRKEIKKQALDVIQSYSNRMFARIEDYESNKFINIFDGWDDFNNYISKQWAIKRLVLFDEQQIWGPKKGHALQKWKLDETENHKRMRYKLIRNHDFYYYYPYVSNSIRSSTKGEEIYPTEVPQSTDAKLFNDLSEDEKELANRNDYYIKRISKIYQYDNNYFYSPESMLVRKSNNMKNNDTDKEDEYISSIESDQENITSSSRTSLDLELEQPIKNKSESGDLSLSNDEYSSEDDFDSDVDLSSDLTSNQEELEDEELENKLSRYLLPGDSPLFIYNAGKVEGLDKVDGIFLLSKQCVYFIQNLTYVDGVVTRLKTSTRTQNDVIDFTMDSSGNKVTRWFYYDIEQILKRRYLLRPIAIEIFSKDGRNCLLVFDINERNSILDKINEAIQLSSSYKKDLTLQEYTDLWVQGQISNFDYLMKLNTFAGRSYNDLTQYPIFPWILKDYTSPYLDLNDPNIYRDLSKPMGAIGDERKLKFIERYESLEGGEVPPFHYGSHYSNAAIVLHYMIRMEPFTQYFIKLQEGKFDRPDRLFDSIHEAWLSASEENMVDVKELIPEFFYLPEFLCNSNKFLFGKKETGEYIDNVILPPWAENDARKFIDIHRKALESPYVSSNLHHWIDLIFGYKQQGKNAKDSINLFYYLTYEGAVDIDKITDPTERQGIIDQINNFGQTPTQLFKKPHPKRVKISHNEPFLLSTKEENLCITHVKKMNNVVGQISSAGDKVTILEPMKLLIPPFINKYIAWGYNDVCLRFWEGNKLISTCSNIYHPSGAVTCVATSLDGRILVTGGSDNVVRVHHFEWIKRPQLLYNQEMKLEGHMSSILQVAVSRSLSIVVSVDAEGSIFVWDLHTGKYLRSLYIDSKNESVNQPRIFIIIDPDNGMISISKDYSLYIWSVNGDLIAYKNFTNEGMITCLTSYYCQMNFEENIHFITGHIDGSIRVYELDIRTIEPLSPKEQKLGSSNLKLKKCFIKHNSMITSLYYSYSNRSFFSGDSSGNVLRWEEKKDE